MYFVGAMGDKVSNPFSKKEEIVYQVYTEGSNSLKLHTIFVKCKNKNINNGLIHKPVNQKF